MVRSTYRGSLRLKAVSLVVSSVLIGSMWASDGAVAAKGSGDVRVLSSHTAVQEYQLVNVTIGGVAQKFEQSALLMNGSTMVPMRGIFEVLGSKIEWQQATQTVTATKGTTTIKLTIGKETAYVNGKAITLSAKPVIVNGSTLVPLRFVSEALGAEVGWDNNTYTAIISSKATAPVVVAGQAVGGTYSALVSRASQTVSDMKVKFGRHGYASANQSEYDQVMQKVETALKGYDQVIFGGQEKYAPYYEAFASGTDKASNYSSSDTAFRGLTLANNSIGALVKDGVPKDTIIKAYKTGSIASSLIKGIKDPLNAKPLSAYDSLFRGQADCDTDAQTFSATFDAMGFNTAIIAGDGHADMFVELGGNWYLYASGAFQKLDVASALAQGSGNYIMSGPTFGGAIK